MVQSGSLLLLFLFLFGSCNFHSNDSIVVAVASSMQPVAKELIETYNENNSAKVELIVGSSGKLTTQIMNGAAIDIFLSADSNYLIYLAEKGKMDEGYGKLVSDQLVVWNRQEDYRNDPIDKMLKEAKTIGIANPQLAPYGKAAVIYLKNLNLYEAVKGQLIYAESVAQLNQLIYSEVVDVAITANSIRYNSQHQNIGVFVDADTLFYAAPVITYGQISHKNQKTASAEKFLKFLQSPKANDIYNKYGYIIL